MNVIVMRRDLTEQELAALKQHYPKEAIQVHRTAPQSADEHLADCRRLQARIVFLPHEQPIPVPAMKQGVKHLLLKEGRLCELQPLEPTFTPFARQD